LLYAVLDLKSGSPPRSTAARVNDAATSSTSDVPHISLPQLLLLQDPSWPNPSLPRVFLPNTFGISIAAMVAQRQCCKAWPLMRR
jgi:hypothetical protein